MEILQSILQIIAIFIGIYIVIATLRSAIRTFVLPRSAPDRLTRFHFRRIRFMFNLRIKHITDFNQIDAIMALYAPLTLITLPFLWLVLIMFGYMLVFWGTGVRAGEAPALSAESFILALRESGSSLTTLGFVAPESLLHSLIAISEGMIGPVMIALLIAYLPTIYAAFSKREAPVTMLEVRAGSPFSVTEFFRRVVRFAGVEELNEVWRAWEVWFTELEETHTSLASLVFFRSQQPTRSWITAAGLILDAAAIQLSALDLPDNGYAPLTIRAGYLALRRIADFFGIPYNPNPEATDPISITKMEFMEVYDGLAMLNLFPMNPDREAAWRAYAGWRVNYDTVLIALATLTVAPYAPWSSDRGLRGERPMLFETPAERQESAE